MDDTQRFTDIFRSCYAHVLAYVRRRVGADGAQDVVAETFLAAWRHVDELPAEPLPWLYRAASFEIGRHRRRLGSQNRAGESGGRPGQESSAPDPADEVVVGDRWAGAFALLGERDREVLRLIAWEGLSTAEAAAVLGCSTTAFKVRLHRARRRLHTLLEPNSEMAPALHPGIPLFPTEATS